MIKKKVITDRNKIVETKDIRNLYAGNGIKGTDILVMDDITGKPLFRGSNKVIMPGSAYTASKHFGIDPVVTLPTYNEALGLDNTVSTLASNNKIICLFSVGTDGAGAESSQILDVDYTKWCAPENLVPFRYPVSLSDLSNEEREIYFGRKNLTNHIAYYFKKFELDPVMYMQYTDGTPVDGNLYESTNKLEAETVIELNLKITKEDCREFFIANSSISEAKINTISLLAAWYTEIDGIKYFQSIEPITKLNITTEPLSDETKGLDIVYHIYY